MIPKIIHYCWFGPNEIPHNQKKLIDDWKRLMPDYTFVCWNENSIPLDSSPFLQQAYEAKMWAFVADYVRVYALFNMGGVYLDTDVEVKQKFDSYLNYSMFTSVEYHPSYSDAPLLSKMIDKSGNRLTSLRPDVKIPGIGLMSATIGAQKDFVFLKELLDWYNNMSFADNRKNNYTIPSTLAIIAERYGFKYINQLQLLKNNIIIFPADVFADFRTSSKDSITVHHCEGSWSSDKGILKKIVMIIYRHKFLRNIYMRIRNLFTQYPVVY